MTGKIDLDQRGEYGEEDAELCKDLWRSVLTAAINDAVYGTVANNVSISMQSKVTVIKESRSYILIPNKDFNEVCYLAQLDPQAVREHVSKLIAVAPTPEELAIPLKKGQRRSPVNGIAKDRRRGRGTLQLNAL